MIAPLQIGGRHGARRGALGRVDSTGTTPMKKQQNKPMKLSLKLRGAGLRAGNSILLRCVTLPLFLLGPGLMLVQPCTAAPFAFENTGNLDTTRYQHTATLLPNGKVLVAGGYDSSCILLASAELYDPANGTWSATGSLNTAR